MDMRSFSEVKAARVHLHPVTRWKISVALPVLSLYAFMACRELIYAVVGKEF